MFVQYGLRTLDIIDYQYYWVWMPDCFETDVYGRKVWSGGEIVYFGSRTISVRPMSEAEHMIASSRLMYDTEINGRIEAYLLDGITNIIPDE